MYGLPCTKATWKTSRIAMPIGNLSFSYLRSSDVQMQMGDRITVQADNRRATSTPEIIFTGIVFKTEYDENELIHVTAYDCLRYLKAKSSYVWEKKTLPQMVAQIASEYKLPVGILADTGVPITDVCENQGILDMLTTFLLETNMKSGDLFNLYVNGRGQICIQRVQDMYVPDPMIGDDSLMYGYQFSESIDENTYNAISVVRKDKQSGKTNIVFEKDEESIERYGMLTMVKNSDNETATQKEWATALLSQRKYPTLSSSIKALGDFRVRAGSLIDVSIGDIGIHQTRFVVDRCTHTMTSGSHVMQIEPFMPQALYKTYRGG